MIGCPALLGGGSFIPRTISGLQLWLAADKIPGATHLGSVLTWPDQSGNGRDGTQGTPANAPGWNIASGPNSKPCVTFISTLRWLDITMPTSFTSGEAFIVLANNVESANNGLWDFSSDAVQSTHYPYTDGNLYDGWGSTSRKNTGNPTPTLTNWHLYNVRTAANAWSNHINGTQHYTTATNTVGWKAAATLGRGLFATGFYWRGSIAELLVYNSVLSAGNRTAIHAYLAAKYGLTIA